MVAVLLPKRLPAGLSVLKILPILEPSSFLILAKRPVPVLVEFPKREEPVLNKELVVDEKSPVVGGRLPNKLDPAGLVSSFLSLLPFKFPKREEPVVAGLTSSFLSPLVVSEVALDFSSLDSAGIVSSSF